jgi:PPOX class probable F420-dependent enzyme
MSDPESSRDRHLGMTVNAIVGTIRRDGSIQLSPNWYLWTGHSVLISTPGWTAKVHNVRRDPRATVCIDDAVTGRYVVIAGPATVIDDGSVRELTLSLIAKYVPQSEVLPHWERINRKGDRVVIEVLADRVLWREGF